MDKRQVAVLMGGMSAEHEVSLSSGKQVAESLNKEKYDVTPIIISKSGDWQFPGKEPLAIHDAVAELQRRHFDCVFLALHGPFGEDGRLQGMLDLLRQAGGVCESRKLIARAVAAGIGPHLAWRALTDSPLIYRVAPGVYGLVGMNPGARPTEQPETAVDPSSEEA